jgi:hypothetical protein
MKMFQLIFCFAFLYTGAFSQTRKMPYIRSSEQMTCDKDAADGKINGYTEIEFAADSSCLPDTAFIFKAEFYPTGFLRLTESYDYIKAPQAAENEGEPVFRQLAARMASTIQNGTRVVYSYDTNNNLLTRKTYKIALKNSFAALDKLLDEYARKNRARNINEKQSRKDFSRFIDSLNKVDIPEVTEQTRETDYVYDQDNNLVSSKELYATDDRRFFYKYYSDGRVASRKEVFRKNNSNPALTAYEVHFVYRPDGKIDSLITYTAEDDTASIAIEKNLHRAEHFVYNKKGQQERHLSIEPGTDAQQLELMSYKDTLLTKQVILRIDTATAETDTVSKTVYNYKRGLISSIKYTYTGNKLYLVEKEEKLYDDNGLLTEVRTYETDAGYPREPAQLRKKQLFIYTRK